MSFRRQGVLSEKKLEMLHYLAETDLTVKEIAFKINISYSTAKMYSHMIYVYTGTRNRHGLTKKHFTNDIEMLEPEPMEESTLS